MPLVNATDFDALVARFEAAGKNAKKELERASISSQRASRTEFSRSSRAIYNVKAGSLNSHLRVVRKGQLVYSVDGEKTGITVASYGARQTAKGLVFKIKKGGSQQLIKSGFIPKKGEKAGVSLKRIGKPRMPISAVYGPSAADILKIPAVEAPALEITKKRLNDDIERRINRIVTGG